jgi:hypothetical protein
MAEVVETETVESTARPAASDFVVGRPRLSWGAVFGGTVAALGLWALLYVFGLAIGLSTIDPNGVRSLRPSALFAGIWAVIAPLVALFIGGWVAGRGAGFVGRAGGAVHGLVVWSLTTIFGGALILAGLSTIVSGVATVGHAVTHGDTPPTAAAEPGPEAAPALSLNVGDALRPVNDRLMARGQPPVSVGAVEDAARRAASAALAQGHWDRDTLANALTLDTGLSQSDAGEVVDRLEAQYREQITDMQMRAQDAADNARANALKTAGKSGKAFWGLFGALLFGLISAVLGGSAGASTLPRRLWREERRQRRTLTPTSTTTTPLGPPREVYP